MADEPRSTEEIAAAEDVIFLRRWYLVSLAHFLDDPVSLEARVRVTGENAEAHLDDLANQDDLYRRGWLDGAQQALRWALGDGERIEDASLDT